MARRRRMWGMLRAGAAGKGHRRRVRARKDVRRVAHLERRGDRERALAGVGGRVEDRLGRGAHRERIGDRARRVRRARALTGRRAAGHLESGQRIRPGRRHGRRCLDLPPRGGVSAGVGDRVRDRERLRLVDAAQGDRRDSHRRGGRRERERRGRSATGEDQRGHDDDQRPDHGPATAATVTVLEYVPAKTFAGTATDTDAETLIVPRPVAFAALKNFTAAGAVAPAGTAMLELVTEFVGAVHVELVPQDGVPVPVIVEAVAGNVCPEPSLNCIEVIVRFQPPPLASPRASTTLSGSEYVAVWSTPFSVRLKLGVPVPVTERVVPAATVALTVTAAAEAAVAPRAAQSTRTRIEVRIVPGSSTQRGASVKGIGRKPVGPQERAPLVAGPFFCEAACGESYGPETAAR